MSGWRQWLLLIIILLAALLLSAAGKREGKAGTSLEERMAEYAKKYRMVMIVPVYEREQAGVYYNTAAVIDADGVVRQYVPRLVAGRLDGNVPPAHAPTLFARFGNKLALGWAALFLLLSLVASRRRAG